MRVGQLVQPLRLFAVLIIIIECCCPTIIVIAFGGYVVFITLRFRRCACEGHSSHNAALSHTPGGGSAVHELVHGGADNVSQITGVVVNTEEPLSQCQSGCEFHELGWSGSCPA